MKFLYPTVLFFLMTLSLSMNAQTGNKFWFVAPEAWVGHGDAPLYFRITTFDRAATVTVSLPADNGRVLKTSTFAANSFGKIEVDKNIVENHPANQVNNKGILIESTAPITAYYEIADLGNPDKWTLKGNEALGLEFYVPSQNIFANYGDYNGNANEKTDIVATEDNTVVTIVPTVDVTGHAKGIPYQVNLNRGQTYSIEYRDIRASASMAGTYITANKPIAVTISDDSINETSHPHDMIGDQLIPTTIIGMEYIAIRTSTNQYATQKVFVLATQDDTYVYINNSQNFVRHLRRGESTSFDITDNAIYITSTKPVYAYQLSGLPNPLNNANHANELGSALLPTIECTGSSKVSFTRVFKRDFWVQILTQHKNISSFSMYDEKRNKVNFINGLEWKEVKGTNTGDASETWYTAISNMNISTETYTIENSNGLFHLSVLDENEPALNISGSVSYGYFSSYGRMKIEGPTQECQGKEIVLTTSVEMASYRWFSKTTGPNTVLSSDKELRVTRSDKYWVTAQVMHGGCVITDSLDVEFKMPDISLGNDTTVCPGEVVSFNLPAGYPSYQWNNHPRNSNSTSVSVGEGFSETISVTVTDMNGCVAEDDVNISAFDVPTIQLNKTKVCVGQKVICTTVFKQYQWKFKGAVLNTDKTRNFITPTESGVYTLTTWSAGGCVQTKNFNIVVNQLPSITLENELVCRNTSTRIIGPTGAGYSYKWNVKDSAENVFTSNLAYLDLTIPSDYKLEVKDANGCVASATANFDWHPSLPLYLGEDRDECVGVDIEVGGSASHTDYVWSYKSATDPAVILTNPVPENFYKILNAKKSDSGIYRVQAKDKNKCPVSDEVEIRIFDVAQPSLTLTRTLCEGEKISIKSSSGYDTYQWLHDGKPMPLFDNMNIVEIELPGTYTVKATLLSCSKENHIDVVGYKPPTVELFGDLSICNGKEGSISLKKFESENSNFSYLKWNDEDKKNYNEASVYKVTKAGKYYVTAFDQNNCSATDEVDVIAFEPAVLVQVPPVASCENIGVTLTNPLLTAKSYQWFKVDAVKDIPGPINNPWAVSQSGTYGLHIVDVNGCLAQTERVVEMLPVPSLDLGLDVDLCSGESAVLRAADDYAEYQWNGNPALNTSSITVQTTGINTLLVKNIEGCEAQDQINVTIHPTPEFKLIGDSVCAGIYSTLTVPSGISNFEWSTGETTSTITVGKGTYWLKAISDFGCLGADTTSVIWYPVPDVDLGPDLIICPMDSLVLDAGDGYASYLWQNKATSQRITAEMQDTINLVQVQNQYGCYGFATKTVRKMTIPDIELCSDASVCQKEIFDLDAGPGYISYLWSNGSREQTVRVSETGLYWVEVNDGCMVLRDTANVIFYEAPIITRLDTTVYARVAVLVEGGTTPYTYSINHGAKGSKNVFDHLALGEHVIEVEDSFGCIAMDTVYISADFEVVVPPFFTPNGDGYNDTWVIEGLEKHPNSIIKIYDRYGKLLIRYLASDPGWDGRYYGQAVPTDDYWYVVEIPQRRQVLKGHITLKR